MYSAAGVAAIALIPPPSTTGLQLFNSPVDLAILAQLFRISPNTSLKLPTMYRYWLYISKSLTVPKIPKSHSSKTSPVVISMAANPLEKVAPDNINSPPIKTFSSTTRSDQTVEETFDSQSNKSPVIKSNFAVLPLDSPSMVVNTPPTYNLSSWMSSTRTIFVNAGVGFHAVALPVLLFNSASPFLNSPPIDENEPPTNTLSLYVSIEYTVLEAEGFQGSNTPVSGSTAAILLLGCPFITLNPPPK